MSGAYCDHGVRIDDTHPDMIQRCWECQPPTLDDVREAREEGWDAAVAEACKKLMALQGGFRGLLKTKRTELLSSLDLERPTSSGEEYREELKRSEAKVKELEHEVSQGEALVGTLGDAIRNIAAMKGEYP